MPSTPRNRIGEVYGKLTVVRSSIRRSKGGNAYWWCRCTCGKEREVSSDLLSNKPRKKKNVIACKECSRQSAIKGIYKKNDRNEKERRQVAIETRKKLIGKIPKQWLELPLTDAHARELGEKHFFRGLQCLNGHISPYRINGGSLACTTKQMDSKQQ